MYHKILIFGRSFHQNCFSLMAHKGTRNQEKINNENPERSFCGPLQLLLSLYSIIKSGSMMANMRLEYKDWLWFHCILRKSKYQRGNNISSEVSV